MFEAKNCISQIHFSVYFFQGTFYSMKIYISIYSLKLLYLFSLYELCLCLLLFRVLVFFLSVNVNSL